MIPVINFVKVKSLQEALTFLKENPNARIIAGGTDVIPAFQQGSARYKDVSGLLDLSGLDELKQIEETKDEVVVGAACSFIEVIKNPVVKKFFPLLVHASSTVGSLQIRNRATMAGNIVNNAPCADSIPSLLVYDAYLEISSADGSYTIPLQKFLEKPYKTQLKAHEIVTKIHIPKMPEGWNGVFYKLGRRESVSISRITLAILLKIEGDTIIDARIASGALTPIGNRFPALEDKLKSMKCEKENLKDAAIALGKHILEVTGLRWSSPYKLPVVQQLFYQELCKLIFGKVQ